MGQHVAGVLPHRDTEHRRAGSDDVVDLSRYAGHNPRPVIFVCVLSHADKARRPRRHQQMTTRRKRRSGGHGQKKHSSSVQRPTVGLMHGPADYRTWLERYADYYDTDADREAGYRDYLANHADVTAAIDAKPSP